MPPHFIIAGMVASQLADAVTFTIAIMRYGITLEANAIAVNLYEVGGIAMVLIGKGAVIVVALAILVLAAHRFPRVLIIGGAVATSIGILGFLTNTLSLAVLGL